MNRPAARIAAIVLTLASASACGDDDVGQSPPQALEAEFSDVVDVNAPSTGPFKADSFESTKHGEISEIYGTETSSGRSLDFAHAADFVPGTSYVLGGAEPSKEKVSFVFAVHAENKQWRAEGGSMVIESVEGIVVKFSFENARMQPVAGDATGTFTLSGRGTAYLR